MATFEIHPEYERKDIEVELAQMAGTTLQLLSQDLKMANDNLDIENSLNTNLDVFIKTYDETHKKNEELDPENLVAITISHNMDDLLRFKASVEGIKELLEGVKDKLAPANYASYAKSLKVILIETDFNLSRLDGDGDGERKAA
jgi:hypothetical protein